MEVVRAEKRDESTLGGTIVSDENSLDEPTIWQEKAASLLLKVKLGEDFSALTDELASADPAELKNELNTDAKKKAFWINIYNAFSQIYLSQPRNHNLNPLQSLFFFEKRLFRVAGRKLSLNGVEHRILRRSRIWWSRGYLKKWFPTRYEKNFRVDRLDPRIHFALNCGAVSCPPIRFYEADKLEEQLDFATQGYLEQEVSFDKTTKRLHLPQLLWFYIRDFKGTKGMLKFINKYGNFFDPSTNPRIKYVAFDRSEKLDNFEN